MSLSWRLLYWNVERVLHSTNMLLTKYSLKQKVWIAMWKRTVFLVAVLRKYPIRKEDNSMYELYYLSVISNFIFCCKHKHWVCKHSTKIKGRLRWNANMSVLHIKDDRLDLQSQKQVPDIPGGNDVGRSTVIEVP